MYSISLDKALWSQNVNRQFFRLAVRLLLIKISLGEVLGQAFVIYSDRHVSTASPISFSQWIEFQFILLYGALFVSLLLIPFFDFPLLFNDAHKLHVFKGFLRTFIFSMYWCIISGVVTIIAIAVFLLLINFPSVVLSLDMR